MSRTMRHVLLVLAAFGAIVAGAGTPAQAASTPTTFSGRATAVKGSIPALDGVLATALPCKPGSNPGANAKFCIADTGSVAVTGGNLEESLLCYPTGNGCALTSPVGDPTSGAVKARVLHAAVVSHGNSSTAEASAADLSLTLGGVNVAADFLQARAQAKCTNNQASVRGSAEVANLTVNGYTVNVAETPNFDVVAQLPGAIALALPVGTQIIVNEQPTSNGGGSSGQFDVNALHVIIPGIADVVVGAAHADIACGQLIGCPGKNAFVTGGGFLQGPTGDKRHFAIAGRNADTWGHVLYKPTNLHVKNPWAIVYATAGDLQADTGNTAGFDQNVINGLDPKQFDGAAIIYWTQDGTSLGPRLGEVLAIDMGEPGRGDFFQILDAAKFSLDAGFLAGGNIQMHGKC